MDQPHPYLDLAGMRVAALVSDLFKWDELLAPRLALEKIAIEVDVIAPHAGTVLAMPNGESADAVAVARTLASVTPNDYDAVLLPGGAPSTDTLCKLSEARAFVVAMQAAGKPFGIIGHGAWLLLAARLVRGRTLASSPALRDEIRDAGGKWSRESVCRDGNWISCGDQDDLYVFNRAYIDFLAKARRITGVSTASGAYAEPTAAGATIGSYPK